MSDKHPDETDILEPVDESTEQSDEQSDQKPGISQRVGGGIAGLIVRFFYGWWTFFATFFLKLFSVIPKSDGLADKIIDAGYKFKIKTTGADSIVHVIYGDGVIKPLPASWHTTENEFRTSNDERFKTDEQGIPYRMMGKYPVVWALGKYAETTDPIEAFMGGQRRRGEFERSPSAATDGGKDVDIHANVSGDDYSGRVISYRDGYRLFGSKVTQEDMKLQGTRAKLAELDWSRRKQFVVLFAFIGGLAFGLFGPALATSIAGGVTSGGGGGITLPFMAGIGGIL